MSRVIDMTDQSFGRLTVIRRARDKAPGSTGATWLCRCDCGNDAVVLGADLRKGYRRSCGCSRTTITNRPEGAGMTNTNRRSAKELDGMASRSNLWRLAVADGLMFIVSRMFHDDVLVEVMDSTPSGWSCSACGVFEFGTRGAPVTCEHVMAATRQMSPESRRALTSVIAPTKPPTNPSKKPIQTVEVEEARIAMVAASAGARAARAAEHDRVHQPIIGKVVTRRQTEADRVKLQIARARKATTFETTVGMARFNQ